MRPDRFSFWRLLLATISFARCVAAADPAAGNLLVAARNLTDPNFAETVVLLVDHGPKGSMGLIVNRPSSLRLSRLAGDFQGAANRRERLWLGGPVSRTGVVALLRGASPPGDAKPVARDLSLLSAKSTIEAHIAAGDPPHEFRIYLGYSGWGPGQLDFELDQGAWHVFPGETALVFDANPETLWSRLIRRLELRFAFLHHTTQGYNREWLSRQQR